MTLVIWPWLWAECSPQNPIMQLRMLPYMLHQTGPMHNALDMGCMQCSLRTVPGCST